MKGILMKKIPMTAAILAIAVFVLLLIPLLYLSPVNRASGDDYNCAMYTRAAWLDTHSLAEVGRASYKTITKLYSDHQGNWFSLFLFSIQPEAFHDGAYCIVAPMMLFFWIASTFYLFWQIFRKKLAFDKWHYLLITVCFLIISVEFIPNVKASVFWYTGCVHYILPFSMCQMLIAWLFQYAETYRKRYFLGITVFLTLLGGSNYQAALLVMIVTCYMLLYVLFMKKERRILRLLLPLLLELTGLVISIRAPGNRFRAVLSGTTLDFSFSKIVQTIGQAFGYALRDIGDYLENKPLMFVGLFALFLIFTAAFCHQENSYRFRIPVLGAVLLFCLHSAMQTPEIYAGVSVSGGVPNTNFQVFLLSASGILLMLAEKTAFRLKALWSENCIKNVYRMMWIPGLLLCLVLLFHFKGTLKKTASYNALRYIVSGEAADYKMQMDLQTRLMEAPDKEDIIVPFINDVQGPLMHMPVTDDPKAFTNWATAVFYGKNSVIAIDRPTWEALYGETAE